LTELKVNMIYENTVNGVFLAIVKTMMNT
jgi:hypothetical protein